MCESGLVDASQTYPFFSQLIYNLCEQKQSLILRSPHCCSTYSPRNPVYIIYTNESVSLSLPIHRGVWLLQKLVWIWHQVSTGLVSLLLVPILFTYKSSFCTFMYEEVIFSLNNTTLRAASSLPWSVIPSNAVSVIESCDGTKTEQSTGRRERRCERSVVFTEMYYLMKTDAGWELLNVVEELKLKYRSHHAAISLIPMPAWVSESSMFGSIQPSFDCM